MSNENSPTSTSQDLHEKVMHDLGGVTDKATQDLDAISQRAAEDVRALGDEASARVGEVTEKAKSFAAEQKDLAASQISGIASAIGRVAEELESSDQSTLGRYARDLSSGIGGLGRSIENNDVDDLIGLAQDFGRKQPLAFLGAAALAGFVASRFSLASAHRRETRNLATSTASSPSTRDQSSAFQDASWKEPDTSNMGE